MGLSKYCPIHVPSEVAVRLQVVLAEAADTLIRPRKHQCHVKDNQSYHYKPSDSPLRDISTILCDPMNE